jgi:ABC-type dipeptide/oligopeptide/nickel transport system permease subunit
MWSTIPDQAVVRLVPPNFSNLLGTTNQGMDVFSQLLYGSRIALLVGVPSAIGSVLIGTLIGLFSGYYGGWVDQVLMRMTDLAFGIPFLPFALIIISVVSPSLFIIILIITLFLWRTTARVIRSQVLSLRERPFIWAAVDARRDPDFVIIARKDALAVNGCDDVEDRLRSYVQAGADVVFVDGIRSAEEFRNIDVVLCKLNY